MLPANEPPVTADDTRPCAVMNDTEPLYHVDASSDMVDADDELTLVLATDERGRVVVDVPTGWGAGVTVIVTMKRGG